jgi:hypothetical protein
MSDDTKSEAKAALTREEVNAMVGAVLALVPVLVRAAQREFGSLWERGDVATKTGLTGVLAMACLVIGEQTAEEVGLTDTGRAVVTEARVRLAAGFTAFRADGGPRVVIP